MSEHQASRTLLKSPPELWTECSDAQSLARHLGDSVGEIRIIRLEPETTVAWEGDRISGTVRLEPSGWGTKVTLTVSGEEAEPAPAPPDPESVPVTVPEPPGAPPARVRFVARMRRLFIPEPVAVEASPPPAAPPPPPVAEPPEPPPDPSEATVALTAALDSLGKAHHRPFSRA